MSSPRIMESAKAFDQDAAEESEEKSLAEEEDPCRDESLQTVRSHVDALLDISAEHSLKEQEPCDLYYSSGWEEARKRRKPKNDEQDPHCLLCVDMRPPEALNPDRPPGFCPESHVTPQDRGAINATPSGLPVALYRSTAGSPPLKEAPQHHLLLRDKMADDPRVRDVLGPSPPPQPHRLNSKHPALKSRHCDRGLPINSFTVLPPVKTPQLKSQRLIHQVCFGESQAGGGSAAGTSSQVGGVAPWSARESGGVERTEETGGVDSVTKPESSKDTYRATAPPTAMYCQSQENRQLLSAFTVPVPRRYEVPLGNTSDTVHRTTLSIGKHWKQALRTGSEYSQHTRSTTPQLPILLGTKVPIVVSGQRRL